MLPPAPYSSAAAAAKPGPVDPFPCASVSMEPSSSGSSVDLDRISTAVRRLHASGFYYEGLALTDAAKLLSKTPVGTFLVRDSADPRYLFALSVQTERGPTNVRIHYVDGTFRLDAEAALLDSMPTFECVLSLVDYYVRLSGKDKARAHVWLDQSGRRDLHIQLWRPLYSRVASLQHLCRTTVAKLVEGHRMRELPVPLKLTAFLRDYPYPQ